MNSNFWWFPVVGRLLANTVGMMLKQKDKNCQTFLSGRLSLSVGLWLCLIPTKRVTKTRITSFNLDLLQLGRAPLNIDKRRTFKWNWGKLWIYLKGLSGCFLRLLRPFFCWYLYLLPSMSLIIRDKGGRWNRKAHICHIELPSRYPLKATWYWLLSDREFINGKESRISNLIIC